MLGAFLIFDLGRANLPYIVHWDYKQKYEVGSLNPVVDFLRNKPYEHRVAGLPFRAPEGMELFDQLYRIEWMQHHFPFYNIQSLASGDALVLALGGGAIEHSATRTLLLTTPGTLLVHLEVELATTLARCRGTEHLRPVLADQANLASRYQRRLPLYRVAHVSIPVDTLTPDDVVDAILKAARLG